MVNAGLAHASKGDAQAPATDSKGIKALFSNRNILVFTIAMAFCYLANATLLPLAGQKMKIADRRIHPYTRLWPSLSHKALWLW